MDRLMQQEEGQRRHEEGVPREEDGDDVRLAEGDGELIEHHAERDAQQAGQREIAQVGGGQAHAALFQPVGGDGDQAQPADDEALHGDLERVEGPGDRGELEHDLHAGEDEGRHGDADAAQDEIAFHEISRLQEKSRTERAPDDTSHYIGFRQKSKAEDPAPRGPKSGEGAQGLGS